MAIGCYSRSIRSTVAPHEPVMLLTEDHGNLSSLRLAPERTRVSERGPGRIVRLHSIWEGVPMPYPLISDVPWLTTAQMIEVDRAMIEDFHIELLQMMENAGRALARVARERFLAGDPRDKHVAVLAGPGGNGGGALTCARRLAGWGANVAAYLAAPAGHFPPVPARQLDILHRIGVPVKDTGALRSSAPVLVIDGIIGYSLSGAPRGAAGDLIELANAQRAPILALDVPSGIDATTGIVHQQAIHATATLTLALPKEGLRAPLARPHVGELFLADIGVPPELYTRMTPPISVGPLFAQDDVVQVHQRNE